jgi:CelD/BcsL family acetyltransferase involved in cellulose biosynthesis
MLHEIDPLQDPRWTKFSQEHPQSAIFHSSGWLQALRLTYGYKPVVFTTSSKAEKLTNGILFAYVKSWVTGSRLVSLPFSDHCQPLFTNSDEASSLLLMLQGKIDGRDCRYFELRPLADDHLHLSSRKELGKAASYYFHRLDLRRSLEEIFRGFHKSCVQRKIRKAESSHLEYVEGRSEPLLKEFYNLLIATRLRHGMLPQPFRWFRNLATTLGDDFKVRLAYRDCQPVASIITIRCGASVVYKYGCSDASLHNLGGMPFLFWRTIQEAKANGMEYLDLGRTDESNTGLAQFKQRLGAECYPLTYYRYPAQTAPSAVWGATALSPILRHLPKSVCRAAGELLYKHVG